MVILNMVKYESLSDFALRSSSTAGDNPFWESLEKLPKFTPEGPWLAGGSIRRLITGITALSDFDVFARSVSHIKSFETDLQTNGFIKISDGRFNSTWQKDKLKVQAIKIYGDSPEDIIDKFDFTICQLLYNGSELITGEHTLWDLGRKRLAVHKVTYPVSTIRRILKYTSQGYYACDGCIREIVTQSRNLPAENSDIVYID
jgi:hypothetical protein